MRLVQLCVALLMAFQLMAQNQDWKQLIHANETATFSELCQQIDAYFKTLPETEQSEEQNEGEGSAYNHYQQWKYFMQFRLTEDGRLPSSEVILDAFATEKAKQKVAKSANCSWSFIDQIDNDGGYWGIGRTTCVTFHPSTDQIYYICSPGGGIWKTTNGGNSYTSSDDGLPYGACSNLLIDPSNTNVLYVSNGDNSGWWTTSTGVYKSTDAGATWLPTTLVSGLNIRAIYELKMSPTDPNVIVAATSNGLYRTIDAGMSWTQIRNGAHSSVCFQPNNGLVIYAALDDYWGVSQVYKSTDLGANWSDATTFAMNHNSIKLATTPLDPNRLLVSCSFDGNRPLFESTNNANSFIQLADTPENSIIAYSPNDVNTMYCGYVVAYRSTNGGNSWTQITDWYGSGNFTEIHADFHYVAYSNNPSHVYFCNDGGMYKYNETTDTWTDKSNGLKIGQFYRIANAGNHDVFMIGGTQDNGGRKRMPNGSWENANGGDGMEVAIQPDDIDTYYTTYINGTGFNRTTDGGANTVDIHDNIPIATNGQWVTPYDLDPNNSNVIVAGYDNMFRTDDQGDSWTMIGTNSVNPNEGYVDLEIAPSNSDIIYASYQDYIYKTINGGADWTTSNIISNAPITRITVHPTNPNRLWVSRGGYSTNYKVAYSGDGGTTWVNYSTGLPNVPCNVIIYEPNSPNRLYVGNDYGVYYRDSVMSSWQPYGQDLPITFVNDLEIVNTTQKLRAGTFGRGIWETDLCATSVAGITETEISDSYALIYPNPAQNEFFIVQKSIQPIEQVSLVDLNGKQVEIQLEEKTGMLLVRFDLPAGMYVLNYTVNGQVFSNKVSVK